MDYTKIKLARYETARVHLIKAVEILSKETKFKVTELASNNFNKLIASKVEYVSPYGNNKTIYRSARVNKLARAWHDSLHRKLMLDFTLKSETSIATMQMSQVVTTLMSIGVEQKIASDAGMLVYLDIVDQCRFYETNKCFLYNQEAFIIERFLINIKEDYEIHRTMQG